MPTCRSDPIADCADLRIVPTLTRHAFRSGRFLLATSAQSCPGAPAQSCLSARFRARDCSLLRDPRRQYWSERAGPDEVSPSGPAVRFFAPQRAIPHFGSGRGRMRPLGFCLPRRRVTLFCRGVHEGRRHNPQVGTKPNIATAVMHERFLAEDVMWASASSGSLGPAGARRCPAAVCRRQRTSKIVHRQMPSRSSTSTGARCCTGRLRICLEFLRGDD